MINERYDFSLQLSMITMFIELNCIFCIIFGLGPISLCVRLFFVVDFVDWIG